MAIDHVDKHRMINEDYNIWKLNTPFLYDLVVSHCFEFTSLTVQWLPDRVELPGAGGNHSVQKLLLGTHAVVGHPNYLLLAELQLPADGVEVFNYERDEGGEEVGRLANKLRIVKRISHDGDVNRARYMPQNNSIIATKTVSGEVLIFDSSKHPPNPPPDGACDPDLRLKGHSSEGVGLSWSPFKGGYLLSSANDAKICLWDTNATPKNKSLDALQVFEVHKGGVEDVAWHLMHEYMFGSVGDDGHLCIWDLRAPVPIKPLYSVNAHQHRVNCLSFNPWNEWVLVTGSGDGTVKLFDLRKIYNAVHTLDSHGEEVVQVGWSPKHEPILASSSACRRVLVWDLSRIGDKQAPEDAEEGPPELLFIHGGHSELVPDFSWNPCDDWTIASVATDNIVQVWKMAEHTYNDDDDAPCDDSTANAP